MTSPVSREVAPGLACFGVLADVVAHACRGRPILLDQLIRLPPSAFHCFCLGADKLGASGQTADALQNLLDQAPRTLLVQVIGELSEPHLERLYALLGMLPRQYLQSPHYPPLVHIVAAGLEYSVLLADDIVQAIRFWGAVLPADAITTAIANILFQDNPEVRPSLVERYATGLKEAVSIGLLISDVEALVAQLQKIQSRTELHAFVYRALISKTAPEWPVRHPAFRQMRDASGLWRPPMPVRTRRRLLQIVNGTAILLEYISGDSSPRPVILLNRITDPPSFEIFGASDTEFGDITSLMPALVAPSYPAALAALIGDTMHKANLLSFFSLESCHGVQITDGPKRAEADNV